MAWSDVIVVGAGIFGQVITKQLRSLGMIVQLIDCGEPRGASRASGSLMKPSWFSSMGARYTDPALELLDRHYGLQKLSFRVGPAKLAGVHWCDPRAVLSAPSDNFYVRGVGRGYVEINQRPPLRAVERLEAKTIIVAAGFWTSQLLPVPGLQGKTGASCLFLGRQITQAFIRPWAPYRQVVAFNMGGDVWVGDGSAIKPENWTAERQATSVERCARAIDAQVGCDMRVTVGCRPFVDKRHLGGRPCYLEEREPGLWVATGGAKNGTIAAGWCAHEIGEVLK